MESSLVSDCGAFSSELNPSEKQFSLECTTQLSVDEIEEKNPDHLQFSNSYFGFVMQGDLGPFITPFAEHTLTQGLVQGSWWAEVLCSILAFAALRLTR